MLHEETGGGRSGAGSLPQGDPTLRPKEKQEEEVAKHGVKAPVPDQEWMEVGKKSKAAQVSSTTTLAKSAVTTVLGGSLRSVVKRSHQGESVSRQPFFDLSLDINGGGCRSLQDALAHFVSKEELDNDVEDRAAWHKTVTLESLPQVLVLQLKRFVYKGNQAEKLTKAVSFPAELALDRKLLAPASRGKGGEAEAGSRGKYALQAVISHHGKKAGSGHYTCDVAVPAIEGGVSWARCDDDKVSWVTERDVLAQPAYVLVYQQATPTELLR